MVEQASAEEKCWFSFSGQVEKKFIGPVFIVRVADGAAAEEDHYYALVQAPGGATVMVGDWISVEGTGSFVNHYFPRHPIALVAETLTVIEEPDYGAEELLPPAMIRTHCRIMEPAKWYAGRPLFPTDSEEEWYGRGYKARVALPGGSPDGCSGVIDWYNHWGKHGRKSPEILGRGTLVEVEAMLSYDPGRSITPGCPAQTPILSVFANSDVRPIEERSA